MNRTLIAQLLEKHEGTRASVYRDTCGHLTIGVGFNLEAPAARETIATIGVDYDAVCAGNVALSEEQLEQLFDTSLNGAIYSAQCQVPNFDALPDPAQAVIVDMVFNLGAAGFSEFVQLKAALAREDFAAAAAAIKDSLWCSQVGTRCADDMALLEGCA